MATLEEQAKSLLSKPPPTSSPIFIEELCVFLWRATATGLKLSSTAQLQTQNHRLCPEWIIDMMSSSAKWKKLTFGHCSAHCCHTLKMCLMEVWQYLPYRAYFPVWMNQKYWVSALRSFQSRLLRGLLLQSSHIWGFLLRILFPHHPVLSPLVYHSAWWFIFLDYSDHRLYSTFHNALWDTTIPLYRVDIHTALQNDKLTTWLYRD